jgi:hypothetical protein
MEIKYICICIPEIVINIKPFIVLTLVLHHISVCMAVEENLILRGEDGTSELTTMALGICILSYKCPIET